MSLETPDPWVERSDRTDAFRAQLELSARPVLILDYDGTLAPFMADKMQAVPYPGVSERLERIYLGPTRLVFVSGRSLVELLELVPLASRIEVWGSHGREHRLPAASARAEAEYLVVEAAPELVEALDRVERALVSAGYRRETERKTASIAVHWRNLGRTEAEHLERRAGEVFEIHAAHRAFAVLPFEAGLELRVADTTKAHAVAAVLATTAEADAVAYLGDDTTDEDAFRALGERGLSLLVRSEPRPSLAQAWLRAPEDLLNFLDTWTAAVGARPEKRL